MPGNKFSNAPTKYRDVLVQIRYCGKNLYSVVKSMKLRTDKIMDFKGRIENKANKKIINNLIDLYCIHSLVHHSEVNLEDVH